MVFVCVEADPDAGSKRQQTKTAERVRFTPRTDSAPRLPTARPGRYSGRASASTTAWPLRASAPGRSEQMPPQPHPPHRLTSSAELAFDRRDGLLGLLEPHGLHPELSGSVAVDLHVVHEQAFPEGHSLAESL